MQISLMRLFRVRVALLLMLATCLAGCGHALYEERLEYTRRMFRHLEVLDGALHPAWTGMGISYRVPKQFSMVPPPAPPPPPAEGEAQPEAPPEVKDERQPDYMDAKFPGLRAAFRIDFPVGDKGDETRPGFIYVLSNHDFGQPKPVVAEAPAEPGQDPKEKKAPEKTEGDEASRVEEVPGKFYAAVVQQLLNGLHLSKPTTKEVEEQNPEVWIDEKYPPKTDSFVEPVPYKVLSLTPEQAINGALTNFTVNFFQQGDIQVIVLVVLPQGIDPSTRLPEGIAYSLETLKVTGDKLGGAATPGAPAAAPGGTPPSAF